MKIIEVDTSQRKMVRQFLELPFQIYRNTPQWVPPLAMDARQPLNRERFPFYRESEAVFLLAMEGERCLGRVAILENRRYNRVNQKKAVSFYFFECKDDLEAARGLFDAGVEWARQRGMEEMYGPKGFTPFDGLGLLVEGFEFRPAFGQPYNHSYYQRLIEEAGFECTGEIVTGRMDENTAFPEKIHQIADLLKERRGFSIARCETRRDLKVAAVRLKELYNDSLGATRGNIPVTDEELDQLAQQMLWFADPKLIKIVLKDGNPVGFLLAYPDISAALQRNRGQLLPFGWIDLLVELRRTILININGAGILEKYRGLGGTALLFSEMYKSVVESRYRQAEIIQIGTDNENMQREMRNFGIQFNKIHRMYSRVL